MQDIFIRVNGLSLSIPIHNPGRMRLFQRPLVNYRVGGRLERVANRTVVCALNNITFSAKPGDKIALLGHNGSGKTTLLRALCGLYVSNPRQLEVGGHMGVVLDGGTGLVEDLTGAECIELYCKYKGISAQKTNEVTKDVMEFTELGDFLYLPVRTYSAGMRSRLSAGLATSIDYDILLIDEGLAAGDAAFQDKFQRRINRYLQKSNILMIASHSPEMLKAYCNRCLLLHKGDVVYDGDVDTALAKYKLHN